MSDSSRPDFVVPNDEIQGNLDKIVADVVQESKIDNDQITLTSAPMSGLPVKRATKPTRALQSPFVVGQGKHNKQSTSVIVFEKCDQNADDADIMAFKNWFNRGYKQKTKKKFNDEEDEISPPFQFGPIPVGYKMWLHALIDPESSLCSTNMDACFYYIRQEARHGPNIQRRFTTTNSTFQALIKDLYPRFLKDSSTLLSKPYLTDIMRGERLDMNAPWNDVDFVLLSILPSNGAHKMLAKLNIRKHSVLILNSCFRTYRPNMVYEGIQHFLKLIPKLMKHIGIWSSVSDLPHEDLLWLEASMTQDIPQQQNGHDCGIFVIKYAHYVLHNKIKSMPKDFDATRAWMDIAATLYKHKQVKINSSRPTRRGDTIVIADD